MLSVSAINAVLHVLIITQGAHATARQASCVRFCILAAAHFQSWACLAFL